MDKFLKQKIPESSATKAEDYLEQSRKIKQALAKDPKPEMVSDFQEKVIKDIPREKIKTLGEILPQKTESDFLADRLIRDARRAAVENAGDTLNYNDLRKQFTDKARLAARNPATKKILGAVPLLGGLASAAMSGDASAAVPVLDSAESLGPEAGSLDYRMEQGNLTDEDKKQLALEQARMQALQTLGR